MSVNGLQTWTATGTAQGLRNGEKTSRHRSGLIQMRSNDPDSELKALQVPIAPDRMLVPCAPRPQAGKPQALARSDAKFLASLLASDMNAETVRSRRRAAPSIAVACYRAALARTAN